MHDFESHTKLHVHVVTKWATHYKNSPATKYKGPINTLKINRYPTKIQIYSLEKSQCN